MRDQTNGSGNTFLYFSLFSISLHLSFSPSLSLPSCAFHPASTFPGKETLFVWPGHHSLRQHPGPCDPKQTPTLPLLKRLLTSAGSLTSIPLSTIFTRVCCQATDTCFSPRLWRAAVALVWRYGTFVQLPLYMSLAYLRKSVYLL